MRKLARRFAVAMMALPGCGALATAQETVPNWPAPALWSHPVREMATEKQSAVGTEAVEAIEAVPTAPLHFVGITPCRVADTRGNGFTGQYGPPALTPAGRDMVVAGQCGIPGDAQAVSFNFSALNVAAAGFFVAYPAGGAFPAVATMTYNQNTPNLSNAAVVPLGTGGAITVVAAVTTIDLVVDVNGYYSPGVVTTLNGLTGNVSLAAGSNVTITPSGQTLTVAATGGLPAGTADQTLRHDGSNWVASSALTNNGTNVGLTGILQFPVTARATVAAGGIFDAGQVLLSDGNNNTFLGRFAGQAASPGVVNTGLGYGALRNANNLSGGNVAVGGGALADSSSGSNNTAIGTRALENVTSGSGNIAIGSDAGTGGGSLTSGSNNIYIGNAGSLNESGQIRIGTVANITGGTVIVGISGFGSVGGIPVIVNGGGRLGTTTSSARFKEDVRNIDSESDGLMKLRPVAFRYKESHEPGRLPQYGLIAEEVAEIYPELVVNDDEGRPFAIRSQLIEPLLLNEVQKQRHSLEAQRIEIENLKAELAKLAARLEDKKPGTPTPLE